LQIAFAFQTFDNIAGKLTNLYFTVDEIRRITYGSHDCHVAPAAGSNTDCKQPDMAKFRQQLRVFAPEIEELAKFFAFPENRTINARIAIRRLSTGDRRPDQQRVGEPKSRKAQGRRRAEGT